MTQVNILGISAFYHDSAACLVRDGKIIAAVQEERFTRVKHDSRFPENAIRYCLEEGELDSESLDLIVFHEKPFIHFERLLETYLEYAPRGLRQFLLAMPIWLREKLWIKDIIGKKTGFSGKILFPSHHESHAAAAFFPSPFENAAILTMDGVGEWATAAYGVGEKNTLRLLKTLQFPHSLGLLYSAFTCFTGFRVNSDEYKVMGLAPFGVPRYRDLILSEIMDLKEDGSFRLNMKYFDYSAGLSMTNSDFNELFGTSPREPGSEIRQIDMDLASSIQNVTEEVVLRMARHVKAETGLDHLVMAGGVALNSVANGRLQTEEIFKDIWIQPAAGDAGSALGAALYGWHQYLENERKTDGVSDGMKGAFLGPCFSDEYIGSLLDRLGAEYEKLPESSMLESVAVHIDAGRVVGWFQGRMEFGPRALGARSILADARRDDMQSRINQKIKFREDFRPFAPSALSIRAGEYFDKLKDSPYMLMVFPVRGEHLVQLNEKEKSLAGLDKLKVIRSDIPAVTHVDNSARVQTVDAGRNPIFARLLEEFEQRTGCPLILNTSFNVREEPIVCSPEDAYRCFMDTGMDALAIGPYLLEKAGQIIPDDISCEPELLRLRTAYPDKKQLRLFGFSAGSALVVMSIVIRWKLNLDLWWFIALCGVILAGTGIVFPNSLVSVHLRWNRVVSRIARWLLSIALGAGFITVLVPTALVAKVTGRRFLVLEADPSLETYWEGRHCEDTLASEHQY